MLQSCGELDFPAEAVGTDAERQFRRQHLDHHSPAQCRLGGDEDPGHATATELPLDAVGVAQCRLQLLPKFRQVCLSSSLRLSHDSRLTTARLPLTSHPTPHPGNVTVHVVSNPPRVLYTVVTTSRCGASNRNMSSATRAVACSWKIPTLR